MADEPKNLLDVVARIQLLEQKNRELEKEVISLKAQLAEENWQELIIYRPQGPNNNKPLEISWTEIDDDAKRDWYTNGEPSERDVIGLVRRLSIE